MQSPALNQIKNRLTLRGYSQPTRSILMRKQRHELLKAYLLGAQALETNR